MPTEADTCPYLLCQMNLLLHGLQAPRIDPGNALRHKLTEIGDNERVDIVITNPPFGGAEEKGIQDNFPGDKRTAETALLFLQLIMRKLRRGPKPGRAAVVVPNGTLFGDGVCARIKEDITHLPPEELAASILEKERRIAEIVRGIQKLLKR